METLFAFLRFLLVCFAGFGSARYVQFMRIPLVTGLLLTGLAGNAQGLQLMHPEDASRIEFIDQTCLSFIAFAAGGELCASELEEYPFSVFRSIRRYSIAHAMVGLLIGVPTLFSLSGFLGIFEGMSMPEVWVVCGFVGVISLARSPSSAIPTIQLMGAQGPFTATVLGVTLFRDLICIMFYSMMTSIASLVFEDSELTAWLPFWVMLNFLFSMAFGGVVYLLLCAMFSARCVVLTHALCTRLGLPDLSCGQVIEYSQSLFLLVLGSCVFEASRALSHQVPEIELQPLLICMISTLLLVNRTKHRSQLRQTMQRVAVAVYVAFFTYVGVSFQIQDLGQQVSDAVIIFALRLVTVIGGSVFGGRRQPRAKLLLVQLAPYVAIAFSGAGWWAGEPKKWYSVSWCSYITQAGVALALTKELQDHYPWGTRVASVLVSTIFVAQLIGPHFFGFALTHVGEAHANQKRAPTKRGAAPPTPSNEESPPSSGSDSTPTSKPRSWRSAKSVSSVDLEDVRQDFARRRSRSGEGGEECKEAAVTDGPPRRVGSHVTTNEAVELKLEQVAFGFDMDGEGAGAFLMPGPELRKAQKRPTFDDAAMGEFYTASTTSQMPVLTMPSSPPGTSIEQTPAMKWFGDLDRIGRSNFAEQTRPSTRQRLTLLHEDAEAEGTPRNVPFGQAHPLDDSVLDRTDTRRIVRPPSDVDLKNMAGALPSHSVPRARDSRPGFERAEAGLSHPSSSPPRPSLQALHSAPTGSLRSLPPKPPSLLLRPTGSPERPALAATPPPPLPPLPLTESPMTPRWTSPARPAEDAEPRSPVHAPRELEVALEVASLGRQTAL